MTANIATCRTLIIEGQALFAKALAHVLKLEPSIDVVGDAFEISEALVRSTRPDMILIDLDGVTGEFAEQLAIAREISPKVRICALSMHLQPEVMQRALSAGADGYVVKDVTPNDFLRAVRLIAAGESHVDPRIAGRLLRRRSNGMHPDPLELSMREREVVQLIVAGLSNKEISYRLNLSEKTVKNHISRIFSKFNCTARTQVAVFALRSGIV